MGACQEMEKQEEEDVFDFGSLKKAASQRGKKKKTKKITRLHLDEFSPFQSTRNTRLLEGGGGYRGRGGRGGRADRKGRQMDRRSAGRFPNDRSQQKKDGSGKFNYGKEIDDYSNPAPDQTNAETNPTVPG